MQSLSEKILKTQPPEDAPSMSPAIWRRGFRDGLRASAAGPPGNPWLYIREQEIRQ